MPKRVIPIVLWTVFAMVLWIVLSLVLPGCQSPAPTAGEHADAKSCRASGGSVHRHHQYCDEGGRSTWWCTGPEGNITGIWFES